MNKETLNKEEGFINFNGLIIKEKGKNKINKNSIYWLFLIPIFIPLIVLVPTLILNKFGGVKGIFIMFFPILIGNFVIVSKDKAKALIMGVFTYIIGWIVFSQIGDLI